MSQVCKCSKGRKSQWDGVCALCRTKQDHQEHNIAMRCVNEAGIESLEDAIKFYRQIRNIK